MNSHMTRYALRYARRHPRRALKMGLFMARRRDLVMGGVAATSAVQDPEMQREIVSAATAGLAAARRFQELSHTPDPPTQRRLGGRVVTLALLGAAAYAGHRAARRFDV